MNIIKLELKLIKINFLFKHTYIVRSYCYIISNIIYKLCTTKYLNIKIFKHLEIS